MNFTFAFNIYPIFLQFSIKEAALSVVLLCTAVLVLNDTVPSK